MYCEHLFNNLYIEIKWKRYKDFLRTKKKLEKRHTFFFYKLQLITISSLNHDDSYMS